METARAHLLIAGRVQGVYYRVFTRNVATNKGISGWVRNLGDGRVEAVFEGDRSLIEQAIAECRRGPAGAQVTAIEVSWEPAAIEPPGFVIRY